jgi:multicomponent Na+:H+ antiporter subunit E
MIARTRDRTLAVAALTVVWMLLWGVFSWLTLAGGLLVSLLVLAVFPLPAVTFAGRLRPVGLARLAVRFLTDLVVASFQLAWTAMAGRRVPRSAVLAVRLTVRSDLNLTMCAEAVSLVPGSLIVDLDRAEGVLYIHVFDVSGPADVERFRQDVHDIEERIVRAVGSDAEVARLTGSPAAPPGAVPDRTTPTGDLPGRTPADATPGGATPTGAAPGGATPTGALPGSTTPADAAPSRASSAGVVPIREPSVDALPIREPSAGPLDEGDLK